MSPRIFNLTGVLASIVCALFSSEGTAQSAKQIDPEKARVFQYWTSERRAAAIPRDLVIDPRGLGYLRRLDGTLVPHGHNIAAEASKAQSPLPFAKPGGGSGDTTPPAISELNPAAGATIGASHTFSAKVTDASGIRSVSFKIQKVESVVQAFTPTKTGPDVWSVTLQGFTDGDWTWWVEAKDGAPKGGISTTSDIVNFKVSTGGGGGGSGGTGGTVTNAHWTGEGTVQTAAGRLYFEMPANRKRTQWWGYVCSGTVVDDSGVSDRSVIITAAHCVYDDVNKAFARNVMFIPDQDGTNGAGTDRNCGNDPIGCWVASFGVVDDAWAMRTFPDNIAWDYAFYVVKDRGAYTAGLITKSGVLDVDAGFLPVSSSSPDFNLEGSADYTHALGYSYSDDPNFMYCAEDMTTEGSVNWWLPSCGLSGGSSGGPWIQPMTNGSGDIISVNSWGYTDRPGMAGPKLWGTSAMCIFSKAKLAPIPVSPPPDGEAGTKVESCP